MTLTDNDLAQIDKALQTLSEHFDTVHLFVTRQEGDGDTTNLAKGRGNYFARYGQIHKWLDAECAPLMDDED